MIRPLLFLVLTTLLASHAVAADSGPSAHARRSFNAATGVYTVASGARFGMSLAEVARSLRPVNPAFINH